MADPEAVDALERRDRVRVLDAGARLDLGEEGGPVVGRAELVEDRSGQVEIVRHAQRHLADRSAVLHA